jgi:RNA polymerase sigma factor (sigma-70 family)
MNDDATLLRRYADEGSEAAFTELVRRHVDLVYGAALRRTGDRHRAADVAQQVFTTLAREARKLAGHAVLAAWLHTATRNAALNLMISEHRRQARESEALALETAAAGPNPDWERLWPLLDAAIDELPETDRAAVILRFLERRPFAEIGAALQVSEDAARMRTDRALDKLRSALSRRGVTSTAAALAAIVSSQPLLSAPAGLAATLATQSLALAGAVVAATTLATLMTTKIITLTAVSALVAFGAGAYVGRNRDIAVPPPVEAASDQSQLIASLQQDKQLLAATVTELSSDIARLNAANAELAAKAAVPLPTPAPVRKNLNTGLPVYEVQQSILNNLRQIADALDQYRLERGKVPGGVHELVGSTAYIKTVRAVSGEDYSGLVMTPGGVWSVTTSDGMTVTYDPSGTLTTKPEFPLAVQRVRDLVQRLQTPVRKAVAAYRAAHHGLQPPNESAVLPYFTTPQEGADYVELMEARAAAGL